MIRDDVVSICEHWRCMPELAEPIIKAEYNKRKPLPRQFAIPMSGANSDWCACMVSEAISQAYEENPYREVSAELLYQKFDKAFGHDSTGKFVRVGDIVFYDWNNNGTQDHVGIVVELIESAGKVVGARVCEGNVNDRMYRRDITFGTKVKNCYPTFVPISYPDEEATESPDTQEIKDTLKQILNYCKAIEKLIENHN